MEEESSHESKLVQQHLANERTFLAWVRTGIATIGLGFLASGIVFRATQYSYYIHKIASIVGISSVSLGILVIALATLDYFSKRKGINNGSFGSSKIIVAFTFLSLVLIGLLLIVLIGLIMNPLE
jgi:putative membrane protein